MQLRNEYLVNASVVNETTVGMHTFLQGFGLTAEVTRRITAQIGDDVLDLLHVDPRNLPCVYIQIVAVHRAQRKLQRVVNAGKTTDQELNEQLAYARTEARCIEETMRHIFAEDAQFQDAS